MDFTTRFVLVLVVWFGIACVVAPIMGSMIRFGGGGKR